MSISISGQNERWAQVNASQPPPSTQSGQNGGWDQTIGTAASPGSAGNAAATTGSFPAGSAGALSDGMSLALLAFGGWGNGSATTAQATGQGGATQGATTTGSAAPAQDESSLESQILTDVGSLIAALTGTTTAPAPTGTTALNASASQNLQTTASLTPSTPPGGIATPPPGPPPWSNDISNTDTNPGTGNAGGAAPGYSDGIQQQFALSAYSANTMSGLDSTTTSSLTDINV